MNQDCHLELLSKAGFELSATDTQTFLNLMKDHTEKGREKFTDQERKLLNRLDFEKTRALFAELGWSDFPLRDPSPDEMLGGDPRIRSTRIFKILYPLVLMSALYFQLPQSQNQTSAPFATHELVQKFADDFRRDFDVQTLNDFLTKIRGPILKQEVEFGAKKYSARLLSSSTKARVYQLIGSSEIKSITVHFEDEIAMNAKSIEIISSSGIDISFSLIHQSQAN